jgi:TonB family protein
MIQATQRSRRFPFGFSSVVHGCILLWVAFGPAPEPPEVRKTAYDELIRPYENRIIWYHLKDKMPDIAPESKRAVEMRASVKAPHTVVSGPRDEPRVTQLVWMPDAEMAAPKPVPLPNVVAVAPKLRRPFTPPVAKPTEPRPAPMLPDAPAAAIPAPQSALPDLGKQRAVHKQWTPPAAAPARKAAPTLTEAPAAGAPSPRGILPELGTQRALHKTWTPPAAQTAGKAVATLTEAPTVAAAAPATPQGVLADLGTQRSLHRPWTPPAPGNAAGGAANRPAPSLPDAPGVSLASDPAQTATLAIVGLNPSSARNLPPPTTSQPAGFSAGAEIRPGGEAAGTSTLVVPGLVTRGVPLMAGVLPIPRRDAMSAARPMPDTPATREATEAVGPGNRSLRLAEAPDPRLEGRAVYSIAIQMPNVTSYYGSWLVWFAESRSGPGGGILRAPSPIRKVDPKYIAAAASERVEGVVRLFGIIRGNGRVESIAVIRRLDDRLDRSAAEALEKWQFEPAMRNGQPVEVDAVFEIPFRLAPRLAK